MGMGMGRGVGVSCARRLVQMKEKEEAYTWGREWDWVLFDC